ncbi:ATP/GTP-binding protein [Streptomyces zhihengii]|uniref:ATP/GTP-binding protein n=1 Tax=Streptomyces zhihengii TaxID=1818004 RepID=A0ABS2UTN2_9ACTN|nr:ATP/GTP-binding protein [Streptomyces zhihengii]MBM9620911.1 ATP/GTP-binding protein [Streptomyces zhihengii]
MTRAGAQLSATKIVVVGGHGTGRTTMVRSVSEIRSLHTEETITGALPAVSFPAKTATTVALDFGRITLDEETVLYLFGTPGQERFRFLWDRLLKGTIGAVVLVDTRAVDDARFAVELLGHHGTPYIVAVNDFGGPFRSEDEIRGELGLPDRVPLVEFDARDHSSSKFVLIALMEHLHTVSAGTS